MAVAWDACGSCAILTWWPESFPGLSAIYPTPCLLPFFLCVCIVLCLSANADLVGIILQSNWEFKLSIWRVLHRTNIKISSLFYRRSTTSLPHSLGNFLASTKDWKCLAELECHVDVPVVFCFLRVCEPLKMISTPLFRLNAASPLLRWASTDCACEAWRRQLWAFFCFLFFFEESHQMRQLSSSPLSLI